MITRGDIKREVLILLNKTTKTKGFYTDDRLDMGIRMSMDIVATESFTIGNGFNTKLLHFNVSPNQVSIPIPADVCYLNQLRFLVGNVYQPCFYDENREGQAIQANVASTLYPATYKIIDNSFYFNPPIINGGTDFLQLECTVWPKYAKNDADTYDVQLNQAMYWFVVFHTATTCVNQVGQAVSDWQADHDYWFDKVQETIQRRNNQAQRIQDFE